MKHIKYYFAVLMSTLCILVPLLFIISMILQEDFSLIIPCAVCAFICFIIYKPVSRLRINTRQEVEYDEFGRSKKKGTYERLSKEERNAIDLQRTADMERVLDSTSIKKMTKEGSQNPEKDMDHLIGLLPVKQKMNEMVARMQFDKKEKKKQNDSWSSGRHMVFYGSPGTGKTTVARILTGFLYKYGYISKNKCIEVDGNFLKEGADTALKTEMVVRQAYGGVLFIDEAYALMESDNGTGDEAIATLIKQMEDARGRFILILAGYTKEMQMLLATNPGFESRIKEYLDFPDYNDQEMQDIFCLMAKDKGFEVDPSALTPYHERIQKERALLSFGNARTARNILDESIDKHALNCAEGKLNKSQRHILCDIDISPNLKRQNFV